MRTMLFHRNYRRFQGGHLKVFHYFQHVQSSQEFEPRVRFAPDSVMDETNPWSRLPGSIVGPGEELSPDALFLAGMDWTTLAPPERARAPVPVVNLIQGFRHTRPDDAAFPFLRHRAVRICVSPEIEESLRSLQEVEGPIFTVPIGLDLSRLPEPLPLSERDLDCVVLAVKDRAGGRRLARSLGKAKRRFELVEEPVPHDRLLELMRRARASVHLPALVEGAYLPALESMGVETLVVCPDVVGNRSFCRGGDTCLVPERTEKAILEATLAVLDAADEELAPLLAAGRAETASRGLDAERRRFLDILAELDRLWESG